MRKIVLDTETTGLNPELGHRVIEIGAVEVVNRRVSGRTFHTYLNPDREIDAGAVEVHGLTSDFLADKPRFPDVVAEFLDFIGQAELVIHNAPFDVGFLNSELRRLNRDDELRQHCAGVLDTLKMAKELHPGQKNNLDALCRRYEVDNSGRAYHGALLDAQLLAEVYLAMTRGQDSLAIESFLTPPPQSRRGGAPVGIKVLAASAEEQAAHLAYLEGMAKECGKTPTW
ncbi:DNA polymerase III subunit epsilon [Parasulfuritortus cantonensis]|uniref:DNA polymerase III subunit epsilon n=1 Tax=Parasulfuritortus cantonensis TaxID=2528202 RepID=A0A4V6NAY1_9PROT|nr:DNA polymerase III subunit epsilon [Parasulfuritortus cantonensis]TCJ13196.1 DNA polymerase III subunit epsilon [Parasulfuritortus cantonensis]